MKINVLLLMPFLFSLTLEAQEQKIQLKLNPGSHTSTIWDIACTANERYLISGGADKRLFIWNIENQYSAKKFVAEEMILWHEKHDKQGMIYALALSPNEQLLAVAGWMGSPDSLIDIGTIRLYHFPTRRLIALLKSHLSTVHAISFSKDSKYLVSGGADYQVKVWDMPEEYDTFQVIHKETSFIGHTGIVNSVAMDSLLVVSGGSDNSVIFWSPKNLYEPISVQKHEDIVRAVAISPDGQTVASGGYDGKLIIYDADNFKIKQKINNQFKISDLDFSPDGTKIVCAGLSPPYMNTVYQKERRNWKLYVTHERHYGAVSAVSFRNNSYVISAGGDDNSITCWDINNREIKSNRVRYFAGGKRVKKPGEDYKGKRRQWYSGAIADDKSSKGRPLTQGGFRNDSILFNFGDNDKHFSYSFNLLRRGVINISPDWGVGEYEPVHEILTLGDYSFELVTDGILGIKKNNTIAYDIVVDEANGYYHSCYSFTPDSLIVSGGGNGYLAVYNLKGDEIKRLTGHWGHIAGIEISEDGRFLTSASHDMIIKIWDLSKIATTTSPEMKPIVSFFNTWDDWVLWIPDGYFCSSKKGGRYVGYRVENTENDIKFYPVEQFDLKYNRPDIIFSRLAVGDSLYRASLYKAYQKRMRKTGFTEEMLSNDFHTPELVLKTRPFTSNQRNIEIEFTASDSKYKLKTIQVLVNGVPVYGSKGMDISKQNTQQINKKINITLSGQIKTGKTRNKIQVFAINEKGTESRKETVNVIYSGECSQPNLYLITIGVSQYADSAMNLEYAAKDANDLVDLFSTQTQTYSKIYVHKLLNTDATKENIKAMKNKLLQTTVDDHVIVFVAGHGLLDKDLNYYFATADIDFYAPEKRGLAYDELENLVDSIPARKKLILIDACHSGEVDKPEFSTSEFENLAADNTGGKVKVRGFKPIVSDSIQGFMPMVESGIDSISYDATRGFKPIGLVNSFELMKELFADLRRGSGAIVVSSAGGAEFAYESPEWNNGVFTYSLLEGLKTGNADINNNDEITVSELQNYVFDKVSQLTGGKQNPTNRRENLEFDFRVW